MFISCQGSCVSFLHRAKGFLSCVSPEWRYGLGEKIWWPEDSSVSTVQTETKPVSSRVKRFWFDFKLHQSVPRVFWRHFDIWTLWIWVLENREHIWTLGKGLKFSFLNFWIFPIGHWFMGWFGDFGKFKWQNFLTIFCWLFSALKLCYLVHIKILYFSPRLFSSSLYVLKWLT